MREAAALAPLTEILPASYGDWPAAAGFALAWAACAKGGFALWAAPDISLRDLGAPYAEGLMQFGLDLERTILVQTRTQIDALWAAEETLAYSGALVLCTIMPGRKLLSLAATRRLLLAAEKNGSRCVLLRLDEAGASAAWTRWRIAAAPSYGEARELGPPRFSVRLERNRLGPPGLSWSLTWDGHQYAFTDIEEKTESAMDGSAPAAPSDRPVETAWRSAV